MLRMLRRAKRLLRLLVADRATPQPKAVVPKVRVERHSFAVADLTREALRDLIGILNARADDIGCVVFEGGSQPNRTVVVFAGNLERFHMLAVARHLHCRVIYVQDVQSGWYQGSDLLPDIDRFCEDFLVPEIAQGPALLFGQSSGAYAALVASTYCSGATVLACAPQTFPDHTIKARIDFVGVRALSTPADIIDVRERLRAKRDPGSSTTIVFAVAEVGNPVTAHFWMDYLHALRLCDLPDVAVSIVNSHTHSIVHGRVDQFATLLNVLSEELFSSPARRTEVVRALIGRAFTPASS